MNKEIIPDNYTDPLKESQQIEQYSKELAEIETREIFGEIAPSIQYDDLLPVIKESISIKISKVLLFRLKVVTTGIKKYIKKTNLGLWLGYSTPPDINKDLYYYNCMMSNIEISTTKPFEGSRENYDYIFVAPYYAYRKDKP